MTDYQPLTKEHIKQLGHFANQIDLNDVRSAVMGLYEDLKESHIDPQVYIEEWFPVFFEEECIRKGMEDVAAGRVMSTEQVREKLFDDEVEE